ncbi:[protein-PII] uridylyltransferase [Commensalibacter oyaizuii]|uniref:Bifunctional uridylyltransferase/uridylyl-removing enzyme n=1 Tax=Commensalibacter oyaizuii TaxID=3043873 RepID=A0ABT6PYR3_9PROT|nr:[protein-PII] uridylyltransferase [Commensalibacter sp. TBRC 16381]MDI2090004.1 [protein-PII] uridylyltransferase [Commensalibacter sp. TBRC 16381]
MKHPLPDISSNPQQATEDFRNYIKKTLTENPELCRDELLQIFRRAVGRVQSKVRSDFELYRLPGLQATRQLTSYIDGLMTVLFDLIYKKLLTSNQESNFIALVATGGYGRKCLAPFSDLDILFLTSEHPSKELLDTIELHLYFLWDMGLKIGHAIRSIPQCLATAKEDVTVLTALLDSRFISGHKELFDQFIPQFKHLCEEIGSSRFILEKNKERHARHQKFGETPYLVEPNIKEGRGGLRDLQTIYWEYRFTLGMDQFSDFITPRIRDLNLLTDQEINRIRRAHNFLWTVRFQLHYIAGRAEDRLTFDMQPVVGGRMGYTKHGKQVGVERFMRHYFLTAREVQRLTYVIESALTLHTQKTKLNKFENGKFIPHTGCTLLEGKILPTAHISFAQDPIEMMRLLKCAQTEKRAIHPLAIHQLIRWERGAASLRGNEEAAKIFLDLLCDTPKPLSPKARYKLLHNEDHVENKKTILLPSPDEQYNTNWLHILNETGILGQLMPEWRRTVGQMQFDTYHIFTVDQHSIEAAKLLALLEAGYYQDDLQFAHKLLQGVQSKRALYMATLLHDMGKGRGADHSELGSQMSLDICARLNMTAEEADTVSWLILHHLLLSHTAFQRDIDDPKTILDLVDTIQSPERLRLLFLLTVSDMRAVNKKVWNAWKATLLTELYNRVAEVLEGSLATPEQDSRVYRIKQNITKLLNTQKLAQSSINEFMNLGYASYWLSFDENTHLRHAHLITEATKNNALLTIQTHPLPDRGVTEVTVYAADHSGLFSKISGALAIAGASIVDARIHTLTNGMVLDTFWIQDASEDVFDEPHRLERISELIQSALDNTIDIEQRIHDYNRHALYGRRMRAIHVPPRVVIDNQASNGFTVIEVNGRDRIGLLYDVTKTIKEQKLQISSAHVTTYGIRAVDVFYVKDAFGLKIQDKKRLSIVRDAILTVLQEVEENITGVQPNTLPTNETVELISQESNPDSLLNP